MKVYNEKIYIGEFKQTLNKRLFGVNLFHNAKKQIEIEPIWLPIFRYEKIGNTILIEISIRKPLLLIALMDWFPFIHIERPAGIQMEDDDSGSL